MKLRTPKCSGEHQSLRMLGILVVFALALGFGGAQGKEAQARNEDVPKGPVSAPPPGVVKPQSGTAQPTTGSTGSADKKAAPGGVDRKAKPAQ